MAALLKVLSFISSTLTIVNFAKHEVPKDVKGPYDSTVRVAVALNNKHDDFRDAAGLSPMIVAFNELGDHVGVSHYDESGDIKSGSWRDITIHQDDGPGQQPTTLQIMSSNDGLCIAYISQTWSDGATRGWLGDMGKECGYSFYYSNIIVGDEGHKPMCTWIDQDHTNPVTKSSALQIHMEDFTITSNQSEVNDDPTYYCKLPALLFKYHHNYGFDLKTNVHLRSKKLKWNDYTIWTGHEEFDALPPIERRSLNDSDPRPTLKGSAGSKSESQRQRDRRNGPLFTHLVVSSNERHSARACCEDDNCSGPDILNPEEGVFCDQSTKMHMPLCWGSEVAQSHCYHGQTHSVVHADMAMRTPREYSWIDNWD